MIRIFLLLLTLAMLPSFPALADDLPLRVEIDRGETIELPEPAKSVFIANPDIADIQILSPTTVMVFGKKMGETTLMAVGANNKTLDKRRVHVDMNVSAVSGALAALLPESRIRVTGMPDGIMLTGIVKDPGAAEDARRVAARFVSDKGEIINRLQVQASNQINLRVRVAEVARSVNRFFGINWATAFKASGFAFGLTNGAAIVNAPDAFGLNTNRPGTPTAANTFNFGQEGPGHDINGFIDALASDGLITLLSEPNLTAMSGETASFLAGGEYPILVPQSNGQISIEYKNFGVKLSFTPTLINESRINIKVRPEVSELSSNGAVVLQNFSIPALKVRRAETTVELASGQSFAIAGMLSNNSNQNVDKFPFLGDTPVLGPLFRSTRFQRGETELVIIVTPYLVRPSGEQLALPTDGLAPPDEAERILDQRTASADTGKKPASGAPTAILVQPVSHAAPSGSGGFIVE